MGIIDVLRLSLTNLRRQKLRTTLTALGVMVGTAAVTTMVSVGIGVKRSIIAPLSKSEILTSLTVQPVAINLSSFSFSDLGRRTARQVRERKVIDDETVTSLRQIPGVITVYPDLSVPVTAQAGDDITVLSVEVLPDHGITEGLRRALSHGSYWNADNRGCVLPSNQLSELGFSSPEEAVGQELALSSPRRFFQPGDDKTAAATKSIKIPIIGIYSSKELGIAGSRLLLPDTEGRMVVKLAGAFSRMSFGGRLPKGQYRALTVKVAESSHLEDVRKEIDGRGYGTITAGDLIGIVDTVFVGIEAALGLIGSVGLIVAFFGIANTMVMSVLERTREIGIMKALGARDRDVRRLFVCEAAAIGLLGGLLGLLASWGLGELLDVIAVQLMIRAGKPDTVLDLFQISQALALGSLAIALGTAILAGLWPAWRAAALEPVAALRHE